MEGHRRLGFFEADNESDFQDLFVRGLKLVMNNLPANLLGVA